MRCGHLFNGIGGFMLAARWVGWQNVWHSEIDEFCNRVTNHHFPESIQYGDIKQTDWSEAEAVDLITGGFPCQPFSQAGKRGGTEDDRYLWPEMFAVIESIFPRWVVAENVYGIVNWNEGMVLDTVLSDLEGEGYETGTYILPAAGTNAPHRRYRAWIVAYSESNRNSGEECEYRGEEGKKREWACVRREHFNNGSKWIATNAEIVGQELSGRTRTGRAGFEDGDSGKRGFWNDFPTQSPVCRGDDGFSGRLDSFTFPKWRRESIKALGNAIVPQVALQIFKAIEQYEKRQGAYSQ